MLTRIVVLPDVHVPNHDVLSVNAVLRFIKFYKPHIFIQLGDFCDWDSVSKYEANKENDINTIEYEIKESNKLLDEIESCLPRGCRKVMLGGNHEDRYTKFMVNNGFLLSIRRMKDFTGWKNEYKLLKRGWEAFDYGQHFQFGKVVFTHGWFSSGASAKKMAECFPGRNVLYGHTHRHEIYGCMDEKGLPIEAESIGTLSRFDLSYLKGKPPVNWIHGFAHIEMRDDGTFTKHFIRVIEGKFIDYGREF